MLIHFLVQSAIQNKFVGASTLLRTNAKGRLKTQWAKIDTVANKMFLQWCRDELVLSFIFVQRFVSWDRTRLREGTTAETQTLAAIVWARGQ